MSYGHAPAQSLRDASATLRARLERNPPHVNAPAAALDPRSIRLRLAQSRSGAVAAATVTDGQSEYAVTLELERTGRRWLVADVG